MQHGGETESWQLDECGTRMMEPCRADKSCALHTSWNEIDDDCGMPPASLCRYNPWMCKVHLQWHEFCEEKREHTATDSNDDPIEHCGAAAAAECLCAPCLCKLHIAWDEVCTEGRMLKEMRMRALREANTAAPKLTHDPNADCGASGVFPCMGVYLPDSR